MSEGSWLVGGAFARVRRSASPSRLRGARRASSRFGRSTYWGAASLPPPFWTPPPPVSLRSGCCARARVLLLRLLLGCANFPAAFWPLVELLAPKQPRRLSPRPAKRRRNEGGRRRRPPPSAGGKRKTNARSRGWLVLSFSNIGAPVAAIFFRIPRGHQLHHFDEERLAMGLDMAEPVAAAGDAARLACEIHSSGRVATSQLRPCRPPLRKQCDTLARRCISGRSLGSVSLCPSNRGPTFGRAFLPSWMGRGSGWENIARNRSPHEQRPQKRGSNCPGFILCISLACEHIAAALLGSAWASMPALPNGRAR